MSGIGRVLAGVLLAGAVGGAAAFAREAGSDLSAPAVGLTAPPPQHIGSPGTVLYALTPPPAVVAVAVRVRTSLPARAIRPIIAAPSPVATPVPERTVIPAPAPLPPRALAAVPGAPAQPGHGQGQGHAWGHSKDRGTPTAD
jgi:hypothetical protein